MPTTARYTHQPTYGTTRDGFSMGLCEAATLDPRIIGLSADLSESTRMEAFQAAFPERYIEVGVAEQNLIGVAAGLALGGKVPFAASYAVFSPGRTWDQLRVSVCYSKLNVKIIGGHAGLTVGPDGATHQALEDIAITRVLPNLTVVVPCDQEEARRATLAIATLVGPAYLRLGRGSVRTTSRPELPFALGVAQQLTAGSDVTIIACGIMVSEALLAADSLLEDGVRVRVINMHTIKPLDVAAVVAAAMETGAIVTAEEHQVIGGLGSAVVEVCAAHCPVPLEMVGVANTFGESGTAPELLKKYGLTQQNIVSKVKRVLERKRGRHV